MDYKLLKHLTVLERGKKYGMFSMSLIMKIFYYSLNNWPKVVH